MNHAHTMAVGAVAYVEHDGTGTIPMPQIPGLPRIEGPSAATHAPHIGEHSIEILKEWGYSDYFISELLTKKVTAVHGSTAAAAE
jgi:crotonobetainyl-CoA:carnitine CoA-transferase CaiB-like acyl-CoA transferase